MMKLAETIADMVLTIAADRLQRSEPDAYDNEPEALFALLVAGVRLYARSTGCPEDLTLQAIAENLELD